VRESHPVQLLVVLVSNKIVPVMMLLGMLAAADAVRNTMETGVPTVLQCLTVVWNLKEMHLVLKHLLQMLLGTVKTMLAAFQPVIQNVMLMRV